MISRPWRSSLSSFASPSPPTTTVIRLAEDASQLPRFVVVPIINYSLGRAIDRGAQALLLAGIRSTSGRGRSAPLDSMCSLGAHFPQRASAAFRAIALRCFAVKDNKRTFPLARPALRALSVRSCGVNFAARAGPPFLPPNRPRATAWGFFRPRIIKILAPSSSVPSKLYATREHSH